MTCNPNEIVKNLILLHLPCASTIVAEGNDSEVYHLMFFQSPDRLKLLCGILSYIDEELESYLKSLGRDEQLKELAGLCIGMGLITESEKSFITGDMEIESQCIVWLRIISILKTLCLKNSGLTFCDLELRCKELIKDSRNVLSDIKLMDLFNCKIHLENKKEVSSEEVLRISHQIEEMEENLKNLEERMVNLSEQKYNKNATSSMKCIKSSGCNLEELINEWSTLVQKWWQMNGETHDHRSSQLSGYNSCESNCSPESILDQSVDVGLSESILSIYNNCRSVSEFIFYLKEIRVESSKILARTEQKSASTDIEKLHSLLLLLHQESLSK